MTPKHIHWATWIAALAAVIAIVPFVTGKPNLAAMFKPRIAAPKPTNISVPLPPTDRITLPELLALRTSHETTSLQKSTRESQLAGQRVTLSGYVRAAYRQLGDVIVEVSAESDSTTDFTVWAERSTDSAWAALPRGAHIEFQGLLKKPLAGELVAERAQLIKIYPK